MVLGPISDRSNFHTRELHTIYDLRNLGTEEIHRHTRYDRRAWQRVSHGK
jgi:hypothetical protein